MMESKNKGKCRGNIKGVVSFYPTRHRTVSRYKKKRKVKHH